MRWTKEEEKILTEKYPTDGAFGVSKLINKNSEQIIKKAVYMKIKMNPESKKRLLVESGKNNLGNQSGELNKNWKGGVSKNNYHYKKIQKERYPEKDMARRAVYYAVKTGKIKKQPCEICGSLETFAHHKDYSKQLEVIWLCRKHHREEHNNRN